MGMLDRALVLETSGRVGEVALARAETILGSRGLEEARRHARDLALTVHELLRRQSWRARELTAVVVSLGPGSFTGLRVGLSSAKALCYAVGCPLLGVPTFEAVVRQSPPEAQTVAVVADALQGMVYAETFERAGDSWASRAPLAIVSLEQWLGKLGVEVWLTGPGLSTFGQRVQDRQRVAPAIDWQPRAESLLRAVAADPERRRCDPVAVEPIYLRGSSAEEKRRAQAK